MKITVHCEGTPEEIVQQLEEMAAIFSADISEKKSEIDIAEIKAKRGRKAKPVEPKEPEDDTESEDAVEPDEVDDESDDDEDFDEEVESEDALNDEELSKLKAALKVHSAKNDKKKTIAILHKFAERSDLVKPADLPKLLKLLKV